MSVRQARWILFAALVVMTPVPIVAGAANAFVPVARAAMLGAICLVFIALESAQGVVVPLAALFLAQAAAWSLGLWLVALVASRGLAVLAPRARAAATLGLVLAALLTTASIPVYRTPFRAASLDATLLEVFE